MIPDIITITAGPFAENGYLIINSDSNDTLIIDPGAEAVRYMEVINEKKLTPHAIVNTHAHIDHVGAVQELKNTCGIPLYLHEKESMIVDRYEEACILFGLTPSEKPVVDHWLSTEQSLDFPGLTLAMLHTPGHTPGGVCYSISGRVFTGDTLFNGSVGRTDFPGGNWDTLAKSLRNMIENYPPDYTIYPGHGPTSTFKQEKQTNPFLVHI